MICLTRLSNSIDWLHHHSNGRRGVETRLLLETDNGGEGKVVKMIVSLLGLCVEICGLNHIIIRKRSRAGPLFYSLSTRHDMAAMLGLLVKYVATVGFSELLLEKERGRLKKNEDSKYVKNMTNKNIFIKTLM